ncbi:CRISPR-associated endonuclease Cas3'' [Melioribacter sp. OK-6-Me]|uniref:CRISPR-associated endonuclease Cas3'' n=1 Tax=unclassified Melioribacter TaxID=2627329 RepID=UPI003EDB2BA1
MNKSYIAHVKQNNDNIWGAPHLLSEHLKNVGKLSGIFASEFNNSDWGELVGYFHDLGKFHSYWQKYLFSKSIYRIAARIERWNCRQSPLNKF